METAGLLEIEISKFAMIEPKNVKPVSIIKIVAASTANTAVGEEDIPNRRLTRVGCVKVTSTNVLIIAPAIAVIMLNISSTRPSVPGSARLAYLRSIIRGIEWRICKIMEKATVFKNVECS